MGKSEGKIAPAGAGEASRSRKSEEGGELQEGYGKAEEEEDEAFCQESVRKKMEVLARMVAMEGRGGEAAAVLTEVVRVMKELDGQARGASSSSRR